MMGDNGGDGIGKILKPFMAPPLTAATGGSKEDIMRSVAMTLGALGGAGMGGGVGGGAGANLFPDILRLLTQRRPQQQRRY